MSFFGKQLMGSLGSIIMLLAMPFAVNHHVGSHHHNLDADTECHFQHTPQIFENLTGEPTVETYDHHHDGDHDHAPHGSEDHELASAPLKKDTKQLKVPLVAVLFVLQPLLQVPSEHDWPRVDASVQVPRPPDPGPHSERGPPAPLFI